jgi:hypothetical protein
MLKGGRLRANKSRMSLLMATGVIGRCHIKGYAGGGESRQLRHHSVVMPGGAALRGNSIAIAIPAVGCDTVGTVDLHDTT